MRRSSGWPRWSARSSTTPSSSADHPGPAPALTAGADELDRVRAATLRMTALAGIGGLPALSVPALTSPSPLGPAPVGVCLVGPRGSDLSLVRHARSLGGPA